MATFGPNNPDRDALLYEPAPTANYGARTVGGCSWPFSGQRERTVLAWDVSSIPLLVTVNSATLTLMTQAVTLTSPQASHVYPLTKLITEGTENGGTTNSGCTWNKYDSAAEGGHDWDTAGGDYDGGYGDAFNAPTSVVAVNIDVTTAVQKALNDYRISDFIGLILMADAVLGENKIWWPWLKEAGTGSNRPTLEIDYDVITISLPTEAGFLGPLRGRPDPRRVRARRRRGVLGRIIAPPLGRARYRQRWIGLWRAFNAAGYRVYWQHGSPPSAGDAPVAVGPTLPIHISGPIADGVWYLSVSWFNGVLDSGFLPIGPAGETWLRFDFDRGAPSATPPRAPISARGELLPDMGWKIHAVYAEDGPDRADEWVIYTLVDTDPNGDPLTGNRETIPMASGGVGILSFTPAIPAATGGEYAIALVRTARGGVESENTAAIVLAGDDAGPDAPVGYTQWSGAAPED